MVCLIGKRRESVFRRVKKELFVFIEDKKDSVYCMKNNSAAYIRKINSR